MDTVFLLVFILWFGSEIWIALREYGKAITLEDKHSKKIFAACVVAAVCVAAFGPRPQQFTIFYLRALFQIIGCVVMICGVTLRVTSVLTLGEYFRTTVMVQEGQKVVQTGVYSLIRHPSYTGVLITLVGLGIFLDNWYVMAVMVVIMMIGISYRMKIEEAAMIREFGKEYRDYQKRTKKLVPFMY